MVKRKRLIIDDVQSAMKILKGNEMPDIVSHIKRVEKVSRLDFPNVVRFYENSIMFMKDSDHRIYKTKINTFFSQTNMGDWENIMQRNISKSIRGRYLNKKIIDLWEDILIPAYLATMPQLLGIDGLNDKKSFLIAESIATLTDHIASISTLKELDLLIERTLDMFPDPRENSDIKVESIFSLVEFLSSDPNLASRNFSACHMVLSTLSGSITAMYTIASIVYGLINKDIEEWKSLSEKKISNRQVDVYLSKYSSIKYIERLGCLDDLEGKGPFLYSVDVEKVNSELRECPYSPSHLSFGGGRRMCPGMSISYLMIKSLLCELSCQLGTCEIIENSVTWRESFHQRYPSACRIHLLDSENT